MVGVAGSGGSGGVGGSGGSGGAIVNAGAGGSSGAGSGGASGSGGSTPDEPAPPPTWVDATGNLAGMDSGCVSVGRVAARPGSTTIVAGVGERGLFASDDRGQSWQPLGTGAGSALITNLTSSITFDPEHSDVFWETGSHVGGGLYQSADSGATFVELGPLSMSQDLGIDFTDPDRKTLLAGTHGPGLYRSTDGGENFVSVGDALPGAALWVLVIDAQTHLMATFGAAGGDGIQRTTNGGTAWTKVSTLGSSHDGGFFRASDDAIYLPLSGNSGLAKSTDLGLTWAEVTPADVAFGSPAFSITPVELPGGKLVTLGADHFLMSSDGGASWDAIGEPLPFEISTAYSGGFTYSVTTKTFLIWHSTCGAGKVLDDGIMSAGYDYAEP